ncbi:MAG: hypothetical protein M4D80_32110 [Myxococcota bacterium]|nr:hypothetical protein [Deltaproteobacteria bacterium]MDQ3339829.1 hypothetical protein [Myxococcota bacterium]
MRILLVLVFACGSSSTPPSSPTPAAKVDPCKPAYAEYASRWRIARSEELKEVGFDRDSIDEVIQIEIALLPKTADLAKLRTQYTAIALFLPDAPWPRALDAAEVAIEACGEEAPHP